MLVVKWLNIDAYGRLCLSINVTLLDNPFYVKDGFKKGLFNAVVSSAWYRVKFNRLSDCDNAESDWYIENNDDEDNDSYM